MLEFIIQNWLGILIGLAVLSYLLYLSITKQWTKVREFAYEMMLLAERTFSDKDGKLKFNFVVTFVYQSLPPLMRAFIKEENIRRLIQALYDQAKDFLDDGRINNSMYNENSK